MSSLFDQIKTVIGNTLSIDGLKRAGAYLAETAEELLPGATGPEKKQWAKENLLKAVEDYDQLLPVIGAWLDLPIVNGLEKAGCDWAVEFGWAQLQVWKKLGNRVITDDASLPSGHVEDDK